MSALYQLFHVRSHCVFEGEVEYTGSDEFEFVDEHCYLCQQTPEPLVIHNVISVNRESLPMSKLR